MKKPKKPTKKRNPIARQATKMRTKVKPSKKNYPSPSNDMPSANSPNYGYDDHPLF